MTNTNSSFLETLWHYRGLLRQLILQEINGRFIGSMLGKLWMILQPLMTLGLYTLVFGTFMKARWGVNSGGDRITDFAMVLFPGLLIFNLFADCANKASSLITSNVNYVKKVVFPLELLPLVPLVGALLQFVIGLLIWICISFALTSKVSQFFFLIPILVLPFVFLNLGFIWIISSLSVYVRDISSALPFITQIMMFLSPVLYPIENIPPSLLWLIYLNPLTFIVESTRNLLIFEVLPSYIGYCYYFGISFFIAYLGLKTFILLKPGFSDVI